MMKWRWSEIKLDAVFINNQKEVSTAVCEISKVIELPEKEYLGFCREPWVSHSFLEEHQEDMTVKDDVWQCILVLGMGQQDGVLVNTDTANMLVYTSYLPRARQIYLLEQYPALLAFNETMRRLAESYVQKVLEGQQNGLYRILTYEMLDVLETEPLIMKLILEMLRSRPEFSYVEYMDDELFIKLNQRYVQEDTELSTLEQSEADIKCARHSKKHTEVSYPIQERMKRDMSNDYGAEKNREEEYVSLPCDKKAYVYYNSVRLQAMEKHLEKNGSSISKELYQMLGELYYELLTQDEQDSVEKKIREGRSAWNQLKDGSREYTLIKIRERGQENSFADDVETFYSVSCRYCEYARRYSSCQFDQFAEALHCECVLTPGEFEDLHNTLMPQNLSAILQFDLDEGIVQVREREDCSCRSYKLEDIFEAAFSVEFIKQRYTEPDTRPALFMRELAGKELPCEETLSNGLNLKQ